MLRFGNSAFGIGTLLSKECLLRNGYRALTSAGLRSMGKGGYWEKGAATDRNVRKVIQFDGGTTNSVITKLQRRLHRYMLQDIPLASLPGRNQRLRPAPLSNRQTIHYPDAFTPLITLTHRAKSKSA